MAQTVFERVEMKYIITKTQKRAILAEMEPHMRMDQYGRTVIRNLYFDTDSYLLIRRSIDKPIYKEKLRLRSYGDGRVFAELKKKYKKVVYKRRIEMQEEQAMDWLCGRKSCESHAQITDEINYFLKYYQTLRPVLFLSYEREAYKTREKSDFRVTFDDTVLCRQTDLSLKSPPYGQPVLDEGLVLMEIKCSGGVPLWMTHLLSKEKIYKTSFSKYGTAYQKYILPRIKEEKFHV